MKIQGERREKELSLCKKKREGATFSSQNRLMRKKGRGKEPRSCERKLNTVGEALRAREFDAHKGGGKKKRLPGLIWRGDVALTEREGTTTTE